MIRCAYCGKVLSNTALNFREWSKLYTNSSFDKIKDYFCNDEHWLEYWKPYFIEEYNGVNIYKIPTNINNKIVEVYIPYIGCAYGYTDLELCRNRINNKNVAISALRIWGR